MRGIIATLCLLVAGCSGTLRGAQSVTDAAASRDSRAAVDDGALRGRDGGVSPGQDRGTAIRPDALVLSAPACTPAAGGGRSSVSEPRLIQRYADRWHEGWLGSPAVVDLDGDGSREVVAARDSRLLVWSAGGQVRFSRDVNGRIWAAPIVGDLRPGRPGLEIAAAARGRLYAWDANGRTLNGFPRRVRDEMRSLAAGDIDGDGRLELVVATTFTEQRNGQEDFLMAVNDDGSTVAGFPPNTSGAAGCDSACYVTGGFDQNVALGDITGDGRLEILGTQDNAYLSLHAGDGRVFDAAGIFQTANKWPGIRFLHDYRMAQQGWADNEQRDNQAHFTNSAPAIADVDSDGRAELIVLGSVQNALQNDRLRGVALWLTESDGRRVTGWESPFHAPDYLAGLWDFEDTNVVAATNQVAVGDLDGAHAGVEFVFAGFDGRIHCVGANKEALWSTRYTSDPRVLTGGVAIADLSGDGRAEVIFASYSADEGKSALFVLSQTGQVLHQIPLPKRGAMAVPTVADIDGDGSLEILVSLKDGEDRQQQLLSYSVAGSSENCLLWQTGRANWLRNGYVPPTTPP